MKQIDGTFIGVRKLEIYYQGWLPDGKIKALLLLVHGLGEHSGRYGNIVNHFVPQGYAVYGFDHIGHGKSGGGREQVVNFEDYTETLTTYYGMVKTWHPEIPIFLLGHSMGGLISAYYLLDHQDKFQGAIISAALVRVPANINPMTVTMGKVLSAIAPKAGVIPLDPHNISRDPQVVEKYITDPLVFHGKTPARLSSELLRAMQRLSAQAGKITLPFITIQGSEDKLVDPGDAQVLYDKAASKDKTIKMYPGLYHEVFNEPERDIVLKDVEDWLKTHV